jgi:triacylglycerol lipase
MKGFEGTAFSGLVALRLGRAALDAYRGDEAALVADLAGAGLRCEHVSAVIPPLVDTQAYVAADATTLIVAFRGTQEHVDFLTDGRFPQAAFPSRAGVAHGAVHAGFLAALDAVWRDLRAAVDRLRYAKQPIWLTGHSLGAALATLAAARFVDEGVEIAGLYTFGSPAVGDPAFAAWFDGATKDRVFRYVNDLDIVTRVPPEHFHLLPYQHVGRAMHFGPKGALSASPDHVREASVAFALAVIARNSRKMTREELKTEIRKHCGEPLTDHEMKGYVKFLEAASNVPPPSASSGGLLDGVAGAFAALKPLWRK